MNGYLDTFANATRITALDCAAMPRVRGSGGAGVFSIAVPIVQ